MESKPNDKAEEIRKQLEESQPVDMDKILKESGMTDEQIEELKNNPKKKLNAHGEIISEDPEE
jgi:hypothetical protein